MNQFLISPVTPTLAKTGQEGPWSFYFVTSLLQKTKNVRAVVKNCYGTCVNGNNQMMLKLAELHEKPRNNSYFAQTSKEKLAFLHVLLFVKISTFLTTIGIRLIKDYLYVRPIKLQRQKEKRKKESKKILGIKSQSISTVGTAKLKTLRIMPGNERNF